MFGSVSYERTANTIHDVIEIPVSGVIVEPVTLAEMKNFMRLEGFESDNESGEAPFNSDDALILELIISAREGLEKWCGISIVPHRYQVLFTNQIGNIELPFSNGFALISFKNVDAVDIATTEYVLRGTSFKYLASPYQDNMTIVYDSGYATSGDVPKRLKQAIMRDVAFHYENRGESGLSAQAMALAGGFKRVSTWLS